MAVAAVDVADGVRDRGQVARHLAAALAGNDRVAICSPFLIHRIVPRNVLVARERGAPAERPCSLAVVRAGARDGVQVLGEEVRRRGSFLPVEHHDGLSRQVCVRVERDYFGVVPHRRLTAEDFRQHARRQVQAVGPEVRIRNGVEGAHCAQNQRDLQDVGASAGDLGRRERDLG